VETAPIPFAPRAPASGPTTGKERLVLVDALRGFALFGVLLVNLRSLTLFDFLPENARANLPTASWDHFLDFAMAAVIDGKSFTLFTLLFGIGFAFQIDRAAEAGLNMRRYVRRLLILLAIGSVHAYLFWWGDILRIYALMGLLLVPLVRLRPIALAGLGVFVAVFLSPLLRPLMVYLLPHTVSSEAASAAALAAFSSSSISTMLKGNLAYDVWTRISAWGLPLYVCGRILIGAALGRTAALRDPRMQSRFWVRLLIATLPLGLVLTTFVLLKDHGLLHPTMAWWRSDGGRSIVRVARSAAARKHGRA
jgi:uncharacterized protein